MANPRRFEQTWYDYGHNTTPHRWSTSAWNTAEMELSVKIIPAGSKPYNTSEYPFTDPRREAHWGNPDWDDVLIPQWWRYSVSEYSSNNLGSIAGKVAV
tara:strand:+ start:422 stop:718 length:297 start_codon:yes stop_codon:yes gene_type:complete